MAFRKQTPSPEPTKYDDPLDLGEAWIIRAPRRQILPISSVPIPTGLNDEEDAGRHLRHRFDEDIVICPNCEGYYEQGHVEIMGITYDVGNGSPCPSCGSTLLPKGTRPNRRKR